MADEFNAAIAEAKRLEGCILEYAPYKGKVTIDKTMDLEPADYADLTYQDLLNIYERDMKIISTEAMGILASSMEKPQPKTAPVKEMETRLREMTSQTLQQAEEVAKEPLAAEHAVAVVPTQETIELEFKTRNVSEIHEQKPEEAPRPEAHERQVIVANVPPALKESTVEAAGERYGRMEEQIRSALGEKADELTLKKKMLELTKQLFKEKNTSRREELKLQITILKNMLGGAAGRGAAKRKSEDDAAHAKIFETMASTQQADLMQTKDGIIDSYKKQISEIRKRFYSDLASSDDQAKRREMLESFVFSITTLAEQLPEVLERYNVSIRDKHAAELEKLKESLGSDEKDVLANVEERLERMGNDYGAEFAAVKDMIGKEIEGMIDTAGADVFKKPDKGSEAKVHEIIKEINETDAGTLLYYLHTHEPACYKKYERKQMSKSEAILKAKELMALEKGLSDSMVEKYFGQKEA